VSDHDPMSAEERKAQEALKALSRPSADSNVRSRLRRAFVEGTIRPGVLDLGAPSQPMRPSTARRPWFVDRRAQVGLAIAAAVTVVTVMALNRPPKWEVSDASGEGIALVDGRGIPMNHRAELSAALRPGAPVFAAMNALLLPNRTIFICDTYVTPEPDAAHVAEMTILAAEEIRRFGIVPKVALLSASNFGSVDLPSARKMQQALAILGERAPNLEVEGEMHGDTALSDDIRNRVFPHSRMRGEANLQVKDAKHCVVSNQGGIMHTHSTLILGQWQ